MIVRIATEGQYELLENDAETLEELDQQAIAACGADDEEQFKQSFSALLEFVRSHGQKLDHERLEGSDMILPPPDSTLEEAKAEFSAEGLIPE